MQSTALSNPQTFWRHVVLMSGARIWMAAAQLAASVLIARFWGAESWGMLASLNAAVLIFVQLGAFGLSSSSTYFVAQESRRFGAVACNALLFGLTTGALLAAILIFAAPDILLIAAAVAIPFQLVTLLAQGVLLGAGRAERLTMLDVGNQTLLLVNAAAAVWLWHRGLFGLVVLNTIASILISLLAAWLTGRSGGDGDPWRPDAQLLRQMIGFGWKFYLAQLIPTLIIRADLLLVTHYRGAAEAGIYAVAGQVGALLLLLPGVIGSRLMPQVAASNDEKAEVTRYVLRRITWIMLVAHLAVVPLCWALPLIYGSAFADVPYLILLLIPGVYLLGLQSVLVQYFSGTGFPVIVPLFWFATLAMSLTLNLLFIPVYGAFAAAAVSSICYTLIFILVTFYFLRRTGCTFRETFIFSRV